MSRFRARVVQISSLVDVPRDVLLARVRRLDRAGAVVLRDPELSTAELVALGRELRALTRASGATLLVADRLDVALAIDADGAHLGRGSVRVDEARRLLPGGIFTRSAHDDEELARAVHEGADAALFSPVFASPGKGVGLGLEALAVARRRLPSSTALVALGGITSERVRGCLASGADGVAAIRADVSAFDVGGGPVSRGMFRAREP